jgi:hypothetical protein
MSEKEKQIEQIELSIEAARKRIEDAAALDRLYKNADFRRIFLDGYFRDEASRTVLLKADPQMQGEKEQKDCDNQIIAIGMLRQHFGKVFAIGEQAEYAIEADRQAREEIMAEDILEEGTVQ